MNAQRPHDIPRTTLVVLVIGVLIVGSFWTLLPFLGAIVWATTIVVATWPLLMRVQSMTGGRRSIATAIMTATILLIFIVPFSVAIAMLFDAATQGVGIARTYFSEGLGPPPKWLSDLPWVGSRIATEWQELAAGGAEAFTDAVQPYVRTTASWVISITGGIGLIVVHFLLTVIIAAILYSRGESAANGIVKFARHIGQERGEHVVRLAGMAIRGVALGVIVTALVQSLLAGLGMWVAGVPRPGLLLAAAFALCVGQLGPMPVLIPAVIWLYWSGKTGWGTALLVWTALVGTMDNILRPILIRRGVDLPMILIIAGVIGGIVGFGIVGIFVGPVILAVTYTLLESWVDDKE
jgi:predicted PurR-regulated permease PerM